MRSTLQLVDQPRRLERREFGIMLRLRRGLRHATNRRGGRGGGLWGRLSRRRGVPARLRHSRAQWPLRRDPATTGRRISPASSRAPRSLRGRGRGRRGRRRQWPSRSPSQFPQIVVWNAFLGWQIRKDWARRFTARSCLRRNPYPFLPTPSVRRLSTLLGYSASHSERLFLPQSSHPAARRSTASGGQPTFPIGVVVAASAPLADVRA
jgi:hypothetical protein